MRALASAATTSNKSAASSSSYPSGVATRSSSRQSGVSTSSGGKINSGEELKQTTRSRGNVLIATTTSRPRCTKSTTTRTSTTSSPPPLSTPEYYQTTTTNRLSPSIITGTPRQPLQARDKNAAPIRTTYPLKRPSLASTTTMSANGKPQPSSRAPTPSLSAGAARAMNKQPLTPKIASRGLRTPQHQTVSVTTPLSRTPLQRSESASGYNKEEVASPVDAFLNNNITPRSGSRQSRASRVGFDSASSTPTGTPNPDSHDSWETRSGLGITPSAGSKVDDMRRPVVTFGSPAEARTPGPGSLTRQDSDSKFFYASDASKSQTSQPPPQPRVFPLVTPQQQKAPTFFYANGTTKLESGPSGTSAPSTPLVATPPVQQDNLMSKFVYADSTRDSQPPLRPSNAPRSGSVVSTASKAPPRLGTPSTSGPGYAQQRPTSPVKLASFSSTKTSNTPPLASPRTMGPVPTLAPASASIAPQRRSVPNNTDTPTAPRPRPGHSRHGSVATIQEQPQPPIARLVPARPSSGASSEASSPSNLSSTGLPPQPTSAAGGFASLIQAAEDFSSQTAETTPAEDEPNGPQSPSKSPSQDAALTELVATARRERKVQDLEITNASLEAINRTLERQLRKQTAEIRRYRRLSRSGRLSLNSVGGNRVISDGSVVGGALARAGLGLDDLSEEEDSDAERDAMSQDEEDDEDYDMSPSESGETSPGTHALRNARQRRRDEQRLQLDLSKHQQLLVDSQKMNQSLRRCLGWTEELIKEGKRALEYKVRVSEVELGGRVLAPEEVEARAREAAEEGDESGEGEEETLHAVTFDLSGATDEVWEGKGKEKQDRDSGIEIELPADGG